MAGYCLRVKCLPISGQAPLAPGVPSFNLSRFDLIDLVNSVDESIPLSVRRSTLRTIRDVNMLYNVNDQLYKTIHKRSVNALLTGLLKRQKEEATPYEFHTSLMNALRKVHDLHFRYLPPIPLRVTTATLGFSIARYYASDATPNYIVSDFVPGFKFPSCFVKGSTVMRVDGIPVDQAVKQLAARTSGANALAAMQMAVDGLTVRQALQATRKFSKISVRTPTGEWCSVWTLWVYSVDVENLKLSTAAKSLSTVNAQQAAQIPTNPGVGLKLPEVDHVINMLPTLKESSSPRRRYLPLPSPLDLFMSASIIRTPLGEYGVLKLTAFPLEPDAALVANLTTVFQALPVSGLVVDVRDNLGGFPSLGLALTKLFSGRVTNMPSLPMTVRGTDLFVRMANLHPSTVPQFDFIDDFQLAARQATAAGETLSGPASDVNRLSLIPGYRFDFERVQRAYHGPVITLTSALTYSAGDTFAILQRDLNASYTVGMERTTGGGGAGTFSVQGLANNFPGLFPNTSFVNGADFINPFLRFYRGGKNAGGLVEHFGVDTDQVYMKTKRDVLDRDIDLFEFLGTKLSELRNAE